MRSMGGMFSGCHNLASLDLSNFETSKVTDISCMFENCYTIEYLDLSNFDTSSVEAMYRLFNGCTNVKSIDVSSFDTSKVSLFHNMFSDCINLEFLNITNFVYDTDIVYKDDDMLDEDAKLHLIITADFYYNIIETNPYLKVIDENVTIIY